MSRLWFGFGSTGPHRGTEPAFYDADALAWPRVVEASWETIRDEFLAVLGDGRSLGAYFDPALTTKQGAWKTYSLYVHGLRYHRNLERFPHTDAVLRRIDGLVSASFSWLDADADIKPHYGDSNAIVRGHLGLIVPAPLPVCGLEVDGQQRGWEAGKMLLFCDAYTHRAWNHAKTPRLVMIIDVMCDEHRRARNDVCSQVLGSLLVFRLEARMRRQLGTARKPLHKLLSTAWRAYLPIQPRVRSLPPR